ncbi:hypothetical protein, partial [Flavobacterium psychrophilum]|uniref:hypothetical protein n=1 Tax=Flavobacterium psychrophilum TaxID=96345 RepID=UPI001C53331C
MLLIIAFALLQIPHWWLRSFYFLLISQGVNINEISPAENTVTIRLPYCFRVSPLKNGSRKKNGEK